MCNAFEIAEKVECYDVELPGNISYCIEDGSFIMYTALKMAEVNGGNILA